jgi:hypothetical protein
MAGIQGFSRLKGIFTSNINYNDYNKIVSTAKNKVIGNLPSEIINIVKTVKPENKAAEIKNIQNGFAESAKILRQYNNLLIEKAQNTPIADDLLDDFINIHVSTSFSNMLNKIASMKRSYTSMINSKDANSILQKAKEPILKGMSNILPKDAKVKISHIGAGGFGNVFKIAFLDKDEKDIFNPIAMKVYKNHTFDPNKDDFGIYLTKVLTKIKSIDDYTLLEKIKAIQFQDLIQYPHYEFQYPELVMKELKGLCTETIYQMNDPSVSIILDKTHGVYPEANSIFKYKKSAGHPLFKTRINDAYLFNLEENYALTPFVDKKYFQSPTSKNMLASYGFKCTDTNPDNLVAGRFIDAGGFTIAYGKDVLMDSTALRYYKKIMNRQNAKEQLELIDRYSKLAQNPKTPLKRKIAQGVNLAKSDINAYKSLYQD